jgi:hypothetical protein
MTSLVQISEEDPWIASATFVATVLQQLEVRSDALHRCMMKYTIDTILSMCLKTLVTVFVGA